MSTPQPDSSDAHAQAQAQAEAEPEYRGGPLLVRGGVAGVLMGLANLVPGISGGTMLLAAGVYPQFINGVADVTTLRFRPRSLLLLAAIGVGALTAIVGLAGPVVGLVVDHRWIMYSLFIGLTLGGAPILWRMLRPFDGRAALAALAGLGIMVAMARLEPGGASAGAGGHPYGLYFLAGVAGASAMVLPGVSGAYLLMILGQYVTILAAVAAMKDTVQTRDVDAFMATMHVVVPVGLGVVGGVAVVSNVVRVLLRRVERATLGVLLGLLLGAVIGLWPFQEGHEPAPGDTFRNDLVVAGPDGPMMERAGRLIERSEWPTSVFRPGAGQMLGALALIAAGFAVSVGIAHIGGAGRDDNAPAPDTNDA